MKLTYAILIAAGCAFAGGSAGAATIDDVKWINQCVAGAGQGDHRARRSRRHLSEARLSAPVIASQRVRPDDRLRDGVRRLGNWIALSLSLLAMMDLTSAMSHIVLRRSD
jgi:hypothetical protein